ncbi:MAG: 30S ribosomal protein S21 [Candidatus Improbicoccus pseudotrichonymphae]|uniref:Small ribosomal subunit protein bS21 n=1 Tax=Candidatus Improbicoccus pseudotrichonymphae TaxID=3033792 RepID=A0AA48I873_9FIRM|nr:MAG: 30S ribosomal protein S21 [Candidatus Improbicoccus pseudotrichonymphae]
MQDTKKKTSPKDKAEVNTNKEDFVNTYNENMLKLFKANSVGIISEIRKRQSYLKPSTKRKQKIQAARRRKNKSFRNSGR